MIEKERKRLRQARKRLQARSEARALKSARLQAYIGPCNTHSCSTQSTSQTLCLFHLLAVADANDGLFESFNPFTIQEQEKTMKHLGRVKKRYPCCGTTKRSGSEHLTCLGLATHTERGIFCRLCGDKVKACGHTFDDIVSGLTKLIYTQYLSILVNLGHWNTVQPQCSCLFGDECIIHEDLSNRIEELCEERFSSFRIPEEYKRFENLFTESQKGYQCLCVNIRHKTITSALSHHCQYSTKLSIDKPKFMGTDCAICYNPIIGIRFQMPRVGFYCLDCHKEVLETPLGRHSSFTFSFRGNLHYFKNRRGSKVTVSYKTY